VLLALHQIQAGKVEKTQNFGPNDSLKSPFRSSFDQSFHKAPRMMARFIAGMLKNSSSPSIDGDDKESRKSLFSRAIPV
jgi:hypothetical protein